jgi:hypothetical protein
VNEDYIRTRAFFLYEHRMRHGLPGSALHDWLEAEVIEQRQNWHRHRPQYDAR